MCNRENRQVIWCSYLEIGVLGLPMNDASNAVEELKHPRKHPTEDKVLAIKEALKYFNVI